MPGDWAAQNQMSGLGACGVEQVTIPVALTTLSTWVYVCVCVWVHLHLGLCSAWGHSLSEPRPCGLPPSALAVGLVGGWTGAKGVKAAGRS